MHVRNRRALFASVLTLLLSACMEGGDDPASADARASTCRNNLAETKAAVRWDCVVCGDVKGLRYAVDGKRRTYAELPFGGGNSGTADYATGVIRVRATAPTGLTFPAGNKVGGILQFPESDSSVYDINVTTYLSDVPQEFIPGTAPAATQTGPPVAGSNWSTG
ncbi:MAG: hypothetical protein HYV18_08160 [Gammaproteobacteria bacterium]|nr:hypothetical protein [Gammaproteobacteria bacterium]